MPYTVTQPKLQASIHMVTSEPLNLTKLVSPSRATMAKSSQPAAETP